ncbi:LytR C-terminal domain-containing protein [Microbacterium stercoris]|uniref:LytR C-terminal domain-containing protein n=1 Tax=Microbacterium stercoris TaxID=2820289 RepID=A0A939TUA4_9MICO|nr:LytR C-terminal domain-containing protein [Microbacterium stercoris]MBO3663824.1 LytR C-terminal domain-containing protein [Microbacterium stercoris]
MPNSYPRDRFDDVPRQPARVGAHRAEMPRSSRGVTWLWAALATVVLTIAGIVGFLVLSQRVDVLPDPPAATPTVAPVIDTTYTVWVLNGTSTGGVAEQVGSELIEAGWPQDLVVPTETDETDFAKTTVYFSKPEDEAAAYGVAEAIGGALVQQSDKYASDQKELRVVVGLDRVSAG